MGHGAGLQVGACIDREQLGLLDARPVQRNLFEAVHQHRDGGSQRAKRLRGGEAIGILEGLVQIRNCVCLAARGRAQEGEPDQAHSQDVAPGSTTHLPSPNEAVMFIGYGAIRSPAIAQQPILMRR